MTEGRREVHAGVNLTRDGATGWIAEVNVEGLLVEGLELSASNEAAALTLVVRWTDANIGGLMMLRDQWQVEGELSRKSLWMGFGGPRVRLRGSVADPSAAQGQNEALAAFGRIMQARAWENRVLTVEEALGREGHLGCGIGKGAQCCAYLLAGGEGFQCGQRGPLARTLRQAALAGEMAARRTPEQGFPSCQSEGRE
jgi:hypothetical protein